VETPVKSLSGSPFQQPSRPWSGRQPAGRAATITSAASSVRHLDHACTFAELSAAIFHWLLHCRGWRRRPVKWSGWDTLRASCSALVCQS